MDRIRNALPNVNIPLPSGADIAATARRVGQGISSTATTVGNAAVNGTVWTGNKIGEGTVWTGNKIGEGAVAVGKGATYVDNKLFAASYSNAAASTSSGNHVLANINNNTVLAAENWSDKMLRHGKHLTSNAIRNVPVTMLPRFAGEMAGYAAMEALQKHPTAVMLAQVLLLATSVSRATHMWTKATDSRLQNASNVGYSGVQDNQALANQGDTHRKIGVAVLAMGTLTAEGAAITLTALTRDTNSVAVMAAAQFFAFFTMRNQIYTGGRAVFNGALSNLNNDAANNNELALLSKSDHPAARAVYFLLQALPVGFGMDAAVAVARGGSAAVQTFGEGAKAVGFLAHAGETAKTSLAKSGINSGGETIDDGAYNQRAAMKAGTRVDAKLLPDWKGLSGQGQRLTDEAMLRNGFLSLVFIAAYGISEGLSHTPLSAFAQSVVTAVGVASLIAVGYGEYLGQLQASAMARGEAANSNINMNHPIPQVWDGVTGWLKV